MSRVLPISGLLTVAMGAAWLVPPTVGKLGVSAMDARDYALISVGPVLILSGAFAIWRGFPRLRWLSIPAAARAVLVANGLFVAFCALEFSDGLILRGGRVFYWTSVLFLPALVLFYGQVLAQRWAWWAARIVTALATVWFVGFLMIIPFVHLHGGNLRGGDGGGRIWAASLTLLFASVSAHAFRSLGREETRRFYGIAQQA